METHDEFPNPARGDVAITIAGRRRVLRPSFAALAAAEAEGKPILALVEEAAEGRTRLSDIAHLLHFCMVVAEGETRPTPRELGEAILETGLAEALAAYRRLLEAALGGARNDADGDARDA